MIKKKIKINCGKMKAVLLMQETNKQSYVEKCQCSFPLASLKGLSLYVKQKDVKERKKERQI